MPAGETQLRVAAPDAESTEPFRFALLSDVQEAIDDVQDIFGRINGSHHEHRLRFLLGAGAKGKRFALPHASVMIHQPLAGFRGQATDIEIHAREILRARETFNELYAKHTGQSIETIAKDTERDNFMSAEQAKAYGIIDEVLVSLKKPR